MNVNYKCGLISHIFNYICIMGNEVKLTAKQERFCYEYCIDFNATQAAIRAGYSEKTAFSIGSENLRKPLIKNRIKELQDNLAETAGISALSIVLEHKKIAYSHAGKIRSGWMRLKDFEEISDDDKACIQSIEYKTQQIMASEMPVEEVFVKVKLYDKQKSLDSLCRILGLDAAQKLDLDISSNQQVVINKNYGTADND